MKSTFWLGQYPDLAHPFLLKQKKRKAVIPTRANPPAAAPMMVLIFDPPWPELDLLVCELPEVEVVLLDVTPLPLDVTTVGARQELLFVKPTTLIGKVPPFRPCELIIENVTEVPAVKLAIHEKLLPIGGLRTNELPRGTKA
jgi:hypothetical protein